MEWNKSLVLIQTVMASVIQRRSMAGKWRVRGRRADNWSKWASQEHHGPLLIFAPQACSSELRLLQTQRDPTTTLMCRGIRGYLPSACAIPLSRHSSSMKCLSEMSAMWDGFVVETNTVNKKMASSIVDWFILSPMTWFPQKHRKNDCDLSFGFSSDSVKSIIETHVACRKPCRWTLLPEPFMRIHYAKYYA